MPSVSLGFKIHIPYQLLRLNPQAIGSSNDYFDTIANKSAADKLADECCLPANKIMLSHVKKFKGKFKTSFSISGTAIEILLEHRPEVIQSFQQLANTGCVEFFSETYYSSFSWLHSRNEFQRQVEKHHELVLDLFGQTPQVFRNTELIYNNELATFIKGMGYKGILCEGLDRVLNGRTANQVYAAPGNGDFAVLLRNVRLSDDIAFRFDDTTWNEQPFTADKFARWLHESGETCNVNLIFDYETFGIHKKKTTGMFSFLEHLPAEILKKDEWKFITAGEAIDNCYPKDIYDSPKTISWEDKEKQSCVSCENMMQNNTLKKIYAIEKKVKDSNIPGALECWGRLQSADHFYYMCDEGRLVNDTYQALNPFANAKEAFENYKNAVTDFEIKLIQKGLADIKSGHKAEHTGTLYSSIF